VITAEKLRARNVKDLAAMARRKGVSGWHSMRKEQLVKALLKSAKAEAARKGPAAGSDSIRAANGRFESPRREPSVEALARLKKIRAKLAQAKDLAQKAVLEHRIATKDRLVVMVRDPYWLHAYWELTPRSIKRAEVALGRHWHGARPILRVSEITRDGIATASRTVVRDIEIHGGVNNWYVDVQDPPKRYQMEVGYLDTNGKFLSLARSNIVNTCLPKDARPIDGNWAGVAEDFDRIYALSGGYAADSEHSELKEVFEKQLRRPMGTPMVTRFGLGATSVGRERPGFAFEVDAEVIVFGATEPGSHVTLKGEPVQLKEDGTFTVRFALPNRRQVLPVVASSGDGVEQRTIVLAVERNTKVMEPVIREPTQ
jgi:hypothetical protein